MLMPLDSFVSLALLRVLAGFLVMRLCQGDQFRARFTAFILSEGMLVSSQFLFTQANRGGVDSQCFLVRFEGRFNLPQARPRILEFFLPIGDIAAPHVMFAQPLLVIVVHRCVSCDCHEPPVNRESLVICVPTQRQDG